LDTISFEKEDIKFSLKNSHKIISWINKVVGIEEYSLGNICYIFCSDKYLHNINFTYLNHDTFTDIITFNYNENKIISGDIFISIERVKENAHHFKVDFDKELKRVMIHGVLHLLGYNDKLKEDITIMRSKEDYYINLYQNL